MKNMFCFQCEQTAGQKACTAKAGVCGKSEETALLQDELTGALIGLSHTANKSRPTDSTHRVMIEGLFTAITNVNFDSEAVRRMTAAVRREKQKLGTFPIDHDDEYDMAALWNAQEDIRSLKSLILFGLRGMAAYAYHALVLGYSDEEVNLFFYKALSAVGGNFEVNGLLPLVLETGRVNLLCMELLDRANTNTYGTPVPTTVSLTVEKGPFIVISGHDLNDLSLLLEQTKDKGVNIYTHGEMLPAHAYPKLKAYPHLKGNFGTAWQNQQREFNNIPAPVLFTTNCLMPPKDSYRDRVFTTEVVSFPGFCTSAKIRISHRLSIKRWNFAVMRMIR